MSSTYRILCVSHMPAIDASEQEWSDAADAMAAASARAFAGAELHVQCDIVVGRYSYPLIEVGCPDRNQWVASEWLLLAYRVREVVELKIGVTLAPGWSLQRVVSLGALLEYERADHPLQEVAP